MRKSHINRIKNLKNDLVSIMRTKYKYIITVKFILILLFSYGLSLYSNGENFPFGMNHSIYETHHSLTRDKKYKEKYKISMNLVAQAGIKWWRAQGAFRWCDIQPKDSTSWDFETEDSLIKWAGERGLHLLPVIGYSPNWAMHPETKSLSWEERNRYLPNPLFWDKYERYIVKLIERYDGDGIDDMPGLKNLIPVKYWQFSNEPYGPHFLGTPEQYAEMYIITRAALKYADSTAKIVGPCMQSTKGNFKWEYFDLKDKKFKSIKYDTWEKALKNIINLINLENIDVVSHHLYCNRNDFIQYIKDLRKIIGKNKPIWITETGIQKADPVRAERGLNKYCPPTEYVTYSSNKGEIFQGSVSAMWAWTKPCINIIDTLLGINDTIILINRSEPLHPDTILYNGGPLIYRNKDTALAIGDALTVFDLWAEEISHNPTKQAESYLDLLNKISDNPEFFRKNKIFFFCADNTIHKVYYPPIIRFGTKPNDTTYIPPGYYRQCLPEVYSIINTKDKPLPAYYILKDYIKTNFPN